MANKAVFDYLQSTNRPYSTNDIAQNLHNKYGKPAVQKVLDSLVEQGSIYEKIYGKQKIYCVKQPDNNSAGDAELKNMETETENITQNIKNTEQQAKEAENSSRDLLSEPTILEAKTQLTNCEENILSMQSKILNLYKNTTPISPEELSKIKSEHNKMFKEYKKRKRISSDIVNAILEGYPKRKCHLLEEVGVETDEDVKMPCIQPC